MPSTGGDDVATRTDRVELATSRGIVGCRPKPRALWSSATHDGGASAIVLVKRPLAGREPSTAAPLDPDLRAGARAGRRAGRRAAHPTRDDRDPSDDHPRNAGSVQGTRKIRSRHRDGARGDAVTEMKSLTTSARRGRRYKR